MKLHCRCTCLHIIPPRKKDVLPPACTVPIRYPHRKLLDGTLIMGVSLLAGKKPYIIRPPLVVHSHAIEVDSKRCVIHLFCRTADPVDMNLSRCVIIRKRRPQRIGKYSFQMKRQSICFGNLHQCPNLHAAARSMAGAVFPKTYQSVRALKGVGDYTAAAICSFAYDMPCAVVDGNVYRVLARYLGVDTPIDSTEGKKTFAALAREMLDVNHPADYNQAIMDFGALVCTPQSPTCLLCPLADSCAALASGRVTQLPVKQHKTKQTDRYLNYLFVRMGDDTLIRKRTGKDIWKNLFELPLLESDRDLSADEFLASPLLADFLAGHPGAVVRPLQRGVKHVLSHRILHAHFYEVLLPADTAPFDGFLRVPLSGLDSYAWPRLLNAFLEKLLKKDSDTCMV